VPCDDGFGYDYYRVHVYQDQTYPYNGDRASWPWNDTHNGWFVLGGLAKPSEASSVAVCGHKPAGGWDCYSTPGPTISGEVIPDIADLAAASYN
jgi:hypothetical protein